MGYSRWSPTDWKKHEKKVENKDKEEIFTAVGIQEDLNPFGVVRESRDSEKNPESTAIIVNVDVTGSMGVLAEQLVKKGVGKLFEEILDRKPVTDPHLMITANGDYYSDEAPFQASQFEADLTITDWLEKVYLEGRGGGNQSESYDLPYYFAATQTSIDCFEKRGKKGYIFTIGDEPAQKFLDAKMVSKVLGSSGLEANIPFGKVIEMASRMYHCFHIVVKEGAYIKFNYGGASIDPAEQMRRDWTEYMGERVAILEDISDLSEVIVSLIEVNEGASKEKVATSWSGDTQMVVANAIKDIKVRTESFESASSVMRL